MPHSDNTKSAYTYFAVLVLFSVPFWIVGSLVEDHLLPGLPASALMVVCPVLVGSLLCWREGGIAAVRQYLLQAFDWARMPAWAWVVALATMPLVMLASAAIQTAMGTELPPLQWGWSSVFILLALFLVAGVAEELGWTGYAARRLVSVYGLVGTGLIIGGVAIAWHAIPLLQAERETAWIAWWAVGSLSRRMLLIWLFLRGGYSVFGAALLHAMSNLSWMLFPAMGSHYDPMVTGMVTAIAATALLFIDGRSGQRPAR